MCVHGILSTGQDFISKGHKGLLIGQCTVSSSDQHRACARMVQPFDVPLFITPWCLPRTKLSPFSINLALGAIKEAQGKQDKCSVCRLQPLAASIHVTLFLANSSKKMAFELN